MTSNLEATRLDAPAGVLHPSEVWSFRHSGYLVLRGILSEEEVKGLREAVLRQFSSRIPPIETNSDGVVTKVSALMQREPEMVELLATSRLGDALEGLLGPDIELLLNRHNHATIGGGADHSRRLHRDVLQWSRTIVSAVVHLDEQVEEASSTRVIPGSHLLPFAKEPNNGGTWMDDHGFLSPLMQQAVSVPVESGDVLLMDGVLFHAAGRAKSRVDRLCLTLGFRACDELDRRPVELDAAFLVRGERRYRGQVLPPAQ